MNRKLLGGLAALLVVVAAVWFFFLRDRGGAPAKEPPKDTARSADVVLPKETPKTEDAPKAPTGIAPRWSMDTDREGPLVLEGQVQGPDGAGVGGATVWLGSVPPRSTKTEADGTFSFDKLVGRTYTLTASNDALVGSVRYKLTEHSDPVVIRLSEGVAVIVTVTDEADKPMAGATVRMGEEKSATTDDKGQATLRPVRPGWVGVVASAEGYAEESGFTTIGSAPATGTIAIKLRKGYYVSGKVVDERGKPIAKVQVRPHSGMWDFGGGDDRDPAITDDAGAFRVGPLAAGSHTLSAVDGEHAPAASSPITITDRAVTGITIEMKAGARVAGKVVDGQQKPVPFATVRVAGKDANPWMQTARQTTSDKDGAFELRGLARGAMQVRAESDVAASKVADVDVSTKDATDLVLVLDVTGMISGRVVDEKGAPVAEVQVNAFPDLFGGGGGEGLALAGMSSATTDGAGAFTVHGLPDGAYRLWAARSSTNMWQEWGQHGTAAKTGDKDVKIVLPAPGGLKGTIVIQGGEKSAPSVAWVQLGQQAPTPVGKDGAFELREVSPGSYDVTFRGPEFAEKIQRDVKIEPGKTTDLGTVTVVRGRRLTGKVVDKNGPVAGAKVKLGEMLFSSEDNTAQQETMENIYGVRSAVTDQSGEFSIIGVPDKATNALAEHPERGRSIGTPVPEGPGDPPPLTLTLRGFGSITGKVTSQGKPLAKVTVGQSIKGGAAAASFVQTADDGTFTMNKVPEGTVVLQAMQQQMMAMKSASVTVNVVAGRQSTANIDIPVGTITLTVTVKPQANNQVDAAQVFMFRGLVAFKNGKEITDGFMQGGAQGMKFWLGGSMPMPAFEELVAGDYSVCTIPITGNLSDPTFQQRIQENVAKLKVYCKAVKVTPSPNAQSVTHEVPAMTPLGT